MYQVIGADGQVYGPVSVETLREWASANRLTPATMCIDPINGVTLPAGQMLANADVFPLAVPPLAPIVTPSGPIAPPNYVGSTINTYTPVVNQAGVSAQPASLGLRLVAYIIDGLIAAPLVSLSALPLTCVLGAPLLCLYWLSRDSFFGGQSIGKKVVNVRAVRQDGAPFQWKDSALRNIIAIFILISIVPIIGLIGLFMWSGLALLEILLVVCTGRRIGDRLANTVVVSSN